jgi:ribosomal-protein-alanine N-acetyltransferase
VTNDADRDRARQRRAGAASAALATERLALRAWRPSDLDAFAALNADPEVMRYFPRPLARGESDALAARIRADWERHGFGLWALERRADGRFLGFAGLSVPGFDAHFTPCVEIGWRLERAAWGRGYATEAARAALAFGLAELGLGRIVSFTAVENRRSRRVMERLGMTHDERDDFDHPLLPDGHPLRRHVLYRARPHLIPDARASGGSAAGE